MGRLWPYRAQIIWVPSGLIAGEPAHRPRFSWLDRADWPGFGGLLGPCAAAPRPRLAGMQFTTLVPAFKPQYLEALLAALQAQTLKPVRVVISDDSPDGAFVERLSAPGMEALRQALGLEVVRGPRQGPWANMQQLMRLYGGRTPLFHMLFDDDLPYPSFYARHAEMHQRHGPQAVVSRRWYAREDGQPIGDLPVPAAIDAHPERALALPAPLLFQHTVATATNWLGEFSNATFTADMLPFFDLPQLAGLPLYGLEDISAFLAAAQQRPLVYLNEHLGYFRISPTQNSRQPLAPTFKRGVLAWIPLALAGRRLGQLDAEAARGIMAGAAHGALQRYAQETDLAGVVATLPALMAGGEAAEEAFVQAWQAYLAEGLR